MKEAASTIMLDRRNSYGNSTYDGMLVEDVSTPSLPRMKRSRSAHVILRHESPSNVHQHDTDELTDWIVQPSLSTTLLENMNGNICFSPSTNDALSNAISTSAPNSTPETKSIVTNVGLVSKLDRETPPPAVSLNQRINSYLSILSRTSSRGSGRILNTLTFEGSDDNESVESGILLLQDRGNNVDADITVLKDMSVLVAKDGDVESNQIRSSVSSGLPDHHEHTEELSWEDYFSYMYYISTFGIVGTILRVYVERFFGYDCDMKDTSKAIDDWFQSLSSNVCVTVTGTTDQTGGALFVVLPCNIIGS
jgi:hypothetical protein